MTNALGQMIFTYYELVLHRAPPFPSLADIGYLIEYPFLLSGILLLPARPIPVASRAHRARRPDDHDRGRHLQLVLHPRAIVRQGSETVLAKVVAVRPARTPRP